MKSPRTQSLYNLLRSCFTQKILLAQQESPRTSVAGRELDWIRAVTGDLPAIRGLDFIHDDYAGVVDRSREWSDRGGIVSICWHTGIDGNDYPSSKEENPDFEKVEAEWIEESRNPEIAEKYNYYYVPCVFLGGEKLYECSPSDGYGEIKRRFEAAFRTAAEK